MNLSDIARIVMISNARPFTMHIQQPVEKEKLTTAKYWQSW